MTEEMSSPIRNHYRFVSPSPTLKDSESRMLNNNNNNTIPSKEEGGSAVAGAGSSILDHLQTPPLAATMYSILMANVVNHVQSALQHCKTTSQQAKGDSPMEFGANIEPSFCYFFVDMQPQSDYSPYCQDYKNMDDPFVVNSTLFNLQRQRSISECSDDSFIRFEDDDDSSLESTAFGCTDLNSTDDKPDDIQEDRKKVHFNLRPKVHVMHAWNFAYRAARMGDWERIARDRERFHQRINRLAHIINPILCSNHREKVYKDRFLDIK